MPPNRHPETNSPNSSTLLARQRTKLRQPMCPFVRTESGITIAFVSDSSLLEPPTSVTSVVIDFEPLRAPRNTEEIETFRADALHAQKEPMGHPMSEEPIVSGCGTFEWLFAMVSPARFRLASLTEPEPLAKTWAAIVWCLLKIGPNSAPRCNKSIKSFQGFVLRNFRHCFTKREQSQCKSSKFYRRYQAN